MELDQGRGLRSMGVQIGVGGKFEGKEKAANSKYTKIASLLVHQNCSSFGLSVDYPFSFKETW